MVVKEKRGRRRYVAFRVDPILRRDDLRRALAAGSVIQCSEGWAIIRCAPSETSVVAESIRSAYPGTVSLATSGTLKTLRERYPNLERTKPPKRRT